MTEPSASQHATTILSGVDALIQLLAVRHQLDERAGLTTATMVSGYPGSPLGGLDLALEQQRDLMVTHRIVHRPGLNEELAAATVWGSQMGSVVDYQDLDGVAGVWYGKGPGLDRSGDALRHGNAMGSGPGGGVVVLCGDDPMSKSSTLACDSQYTFQDACIPVLYPGDQQDLIDLGVHAFWMSRYSGAWVGMKVVTGVADGIGTVDIDPGRHSPQEPDGVIIDGDIWRHQPLARIGPHAVPDQETLVVERRLAAAVAYARHNGIDRVVGAGSQWGVICAGKTYFDVIQAFADLGVSLDQLASVGVRVLRLGMTYPLVADTVLEFADSVDELLVVEEKRPFIETQLRSILHEAGRHITVVGKRDESGRALSSMVGELSPTSVAAILMRVLPGVAAKQPAPHGARTSLPLLTIPARPPGFCSGCPHNRSTVFPDGALVGGGVGCHGIMYFEPRHAGMTSLPPTPMGAEGVPWIGLSPFVSQPHLIQNLGDGTLSHSGTLAIRASVAAGVNVTFKILYNAAVAMTGGQDVTGLMSVPAMTRALQAEGVSRIIVCAEDPRRYGRRAGWAKGVEVLGRDRLTGVQSELERVPGVSIIIYDQQCAAEARRLRKRGLQPEPPRRVVINEAVCEGCGDCSTKSNCLSVLPLGTEFGEKRHIHDSSCNRDYTCLEGDCPSFVTITPKRRRRRTTTVEKPSIRPSLPSGELPMPVIPAIDGQYGVYLTGIGGTGIVTVNRIIATAAQAAGLVLGGLDQTGLSQKAGAVVSHLHLALTREALGSATISNGGADLYLSGDILQAAAPTHLAKVIPGRTIAVVERAVTPTVTMLQDLAAPVDVTALIDAIDVTVGPGRTAILSATELAETVFANHLLANTILLGAAFQLGGLPLTLADLNDAIEQLGRSASDNRAAFAWGRWLVHDGAAVDSALTVSAPGDAVDIYDPSGDAVAIAERLVARRSLPGELADFLVRRTAQVIDYQSAARAERFLDLVVIAAAADTAVRSWALTVAVAESWFKLLTYKDEYEVARLHLKVDHTRVARELGITGPFAVSYHLHPPILRRLGLKKKLPMGRPYTAAFHVLRGARRLRGTPFDVFGWDRDRRLERALIEEYADLVGDVVDPTSALSYDTQVRLASSALEVKGYGPVKEASVTAWRQRREVIEQSEVQPVGISR